MSGGGSRGFSRLVKAAGYSWQGFKTTFQQEAAFRQELALLVALTPVAIWLAQSGVELALMLGSLMLVLIVELLNSAIEAVVDRVGREHNRLSGVAKDVASAAVLMSLFNAALIWMLVLLL